MEIDKDNRAIRAMTRKFATFLSEAAEVGLLHRHHLPENCVMIPMIIITPGSDGNFNYDTEIMVKDGIDPESFYHTLRNNAEAIRQQLS